MKDSQNTFWRVWVGEDCSGKPHKSDLHRTEISHSSAWERSCLEFDLLTVLIREKIYWNRVHRVYGDCMWSLVDSGFFMMVFQVKSVQGWQIVWLCKTVWQTSLFSQSQQRMAELGLSISYMIYDQKVGDTAPTIGVFFHLCFRFPFAVFHFLLFHMPKGSWEVVMVVTLKLVNMNRLYPCKAYFKVWSNTGWIH